MKSFIKSLLIIVLVSSSNVFAAYEAQFSSSTDSGAENADPSFTVEFTNTVTGDAEAAYGLLDYTVLGTGTATPARLVFCIPLKLKDKRGSCSCSVILGTGVNISATPCNIKEAPV